MTIKRLPLVLIVIGLLASAGLAQVQKPGDLKFPPLKYDPPNPKEFRIEFANGLRGYIMEDHSLPLISVSALINFGQLYVSMENRGLGGIMSQTLIKGGTKTREGQDIEDRINFIGGSLSFRTGERTSSLSLSIMTEYLDEGLEFFFDVLMNPEFREASVNLARASLIQGLSRANDQPSSILSREYETLIYGGHPLTWQATKTTYESVTPEMLKEIHGRYFFPRNIILSASGDFSTADLRAKVNRLISGWKNKRVKIPAAATKFVQPDPGVYFIQKQINQGYISMGHLGIEDTNPDYFAILVMNFILGGGSFTSRITTKVRSDEGLSYNQGSRFRTRWGYPGTFSGYVQTKSSTVGYAISLILDEFNRIRNEPVSDAEMETAINYYLESFSNVFESPQRTMTTFANLEMTEKPMDYYETYRDRIKAVTKAKIQQVANKYIQPSKAVIMIVGDFEPCNEGGEKWAGPLEKLGKVRMIKLKDPVTGEETE